ncbi:hypothetical protein NDU88_000181 [Pleurodeles waltl]|uniref:Uncharacterized protein n=1 Tax=Pleurodeles waltl TaxID=8319 RepID=A0AAV7KNB7_PLEWA|nr:hypothetical protein NDU88_000181 [Pleurodeles waltl]
MERDMSSLAAEASEGHTESHPSLWERMEAIKSLRDTFESQIDAVKIDVNLSRADLRKVMDTVTTAEIQIHGLQAVTEKLENQIQELTKQNLVVVIKLEDQEGQAC